MSLSYVLEVSQLGSLTHPLQQTQWFKIQADNSMYQSQGVVVEEAIPRAKAVVKSHQKRIRSLTEVPDTHRPSPRPSVLLSLSLDLPQQKYAILSLHPIRWPFLLLSFHQVMEVSGHLVMERAGQPVIMDGDIILTAVIGAAGNSSGAS